MTLQAGGNDAKGASVISGWQGRTEFGVREGLLSMPKIGYCLMKMYDDCSAVIKPFSEKLVKPCAEASVENAEVE